MPFHSQAAAFISELHFLLRGVRFMLKNKAQLSFAIRWAVVLLLFVPVLSLLAHADTTYQKPPKAVLDILNAPEVPQVSVSPARDRILLIESVRYPSIAELAQPMLRLAGLRINPNTNGMHRSGQRGGAVTGLTLIKIADGSTVKVSLPPNPAIGLYTGGAGFRGMTRASSWSSDGKYLAFTNTTAHSIELWILDTAAGKARKIPEVAINAAYGEPVQWMPDQQTLLVQTVPAGRGKAPEEPRVPKGPTVQENYGKKAPVWTFEDLLKSSHDEDLFDYYATSQLGMVDIASGKFTPVGKPSVFQSVEASPDGKLILVARVHRPYSYLVTHANFPKDVEIWDRSGAAVHTLAKLPLQEQVQNNGVPVGPREYEWMPAEPETLVWVEALDEGNPRAKVPHRDRILRQSAPFKDAQREILKTQWRFRDITWSEKKGIALVQENDRMTRWQRTWLLDVDNPSEAPRKTWDRSEQDRYGNPGSPVIKTLPNGKRVILQNGSAIFLLGTGSSPEGDRPFLDQFDLATLQSKRLYRCAEKTYESVIALLDNNASKFLTRYESPTEPPNVLMRSADGSLRKAFTRFADPTPQIRKIRKQLVTYKRPDGLALSFELYLPPDYKEGERLPTVVWAYPLEYTDTRTASQVTGSPYRFTMMEGMSHLFFLTQGYAVLDNAAMPVVGDSETVNNTYIEQIVADAKAAIDKATEIGVTDPNRVGVGGHSYGAFMTANLLSHCNLFKAGIARSGAYNRTLTPFGFQSEIRTIWEAAELYMKVSPFMFANKINAPILLIHGEADNNSGTFPIQSERYYHALKGNGKTVRYVTLPLESHGYQGRESIEHTLYEMISWFDRYVKTAASVDH
jgi:dipeptidyl aminopeptidase/acylaminoacyl peptidase